MVEVFKMIILQAPTNNLEDSPQASNDMDDEIPF